MTPRKETRWWWVLVLVAAGALLVQPAFAQTMTGTIRGTITDKDGPVPGATIEGANQQTQYRAAAQSGTDGAFLLFGLPPGTYELKVTAPSYTGLKRTIDVLIGQNLVVHFRLTPEQMLVEDVTVVGSRIEEARTAEIATNVTTAQIDQLPQGSRNFLNFAGLAPGINVSTYDGDPRYGNTAFRSGGLSANQVNVFIDGLSYKNDMLKGGAFMQDSMRGNPFPQEAVQEFRVITQNFKAEYERSGGSVVTAVTKSGGNSWAGDLFYTYQNKSMKTKTEFDVEKPDWKRQQFGLSGGGPLVKDKLFFFGSFEQNDQDKFNRIAFGNPAGFPDAAQALFNNYAQGNVKGPFSEKLFFGKLTYQPKVNQTGEFTVNYRDESDRRDFGGQTAYNAGNHMKVKTAAVTGRYQWIWGDWLNSANVFYQQMKWIQDPFSLDTPQLNYWGKGTIGSGSTQQNIKQDRMGIRDDLTYSFEGAGRHVMKAGVVVTHAKYDYDNAQNINPVFNFRQEDGWAFPFQGSLGLGDSAVDFGNNQFGVFVQDDWSITPRLELNLGVRWDYETNMLNNKWVTPPDVRNAVLNATNGHTSDPVNPDPPLSSVLNLNDYFTDGNNRKSFTGAIQPRVGFSYDLTGKGKTVLFGAWGRYYDHVNLQDIYEEQHKYTWKFYNYCFSSPDPTAPPPPCANPIPWDPSYQSKQGLLNLIATSTVGGREIWLMKNDTKPPRSDQWNVGIRHGIADWLLSLSYNKVYGYNGMTWYPAVTPGGPDRWDHVYHGPDGSGFGTILRSDDNRRTWYKAWFLKVEKPYSAVSKWGLQFAYTHANAEQLGREEKADNLSFGFDFFTPEFMNSKRVPGNSDERHHIVANALIGLPWDIRLGSVLTLGSGVPYTIYDFSSGASSIRWNGQYPEKHGSIFGKWAYESFDLSLQKDFNIGSRNTLSLRLEGFNIGNFKNYCGFVDFWQDPNLNKPTCQFNQRQVQVTGRYSFH